MLAKLIPNVLSPGYWRKITHELHLLWSILSDRRVPWYIKVLPVIVAMYLLLPFDLIPEFLPIIGQLDDLSLLMIALSLFVRLAPSEVVEEYKHRMGIDKTEII